jgi:uncharacterized protein YcbK (DUF882 family)
MKLTANFKLEEFLESDFYSEDQQAKVLKSYEQNKSVLLPAIKNLAIQLQVLRDHLNIPIVINIAYRPEWYELSRGRSGTSQHCLGLAADISSSLPTIKVREAIEQLIKEGKMDQGGIGKYSTFVHYDTRGVKARW